MSNNSLKPKWDIAQVVDIETRIKAMYAANETELKPRFTARELELLTSPESALSTARVGQAENLVTQKTQTKSKDVVAAELAKTESDIREVVKSLTRGPDILQAFGIGEPINPKSLPNVVAQANIIINGFTKYADWATANGILRSDIEEIERQRNLLDQSGTVQERAVLTRKVKTVDKNTTQREVEDLITKFSAMGILLFRKTKPELIPLFEDLIPKSPSQATPPPADQLPPAPQQ